MDTTQFFLKWRNKYCDYDHACGPQCVDVIKQYFKDVLGMEPVTGNAIDYWNKPPAGFTAIKRAPGIQPEPGDIIVSDYPPVGHIAICNWSRPADFGGFEQNYPLGSPCHYQDHASYDHVLGWLRPIKPLPSAPRPMPHPQPFVMDYVCINGNGEVMEQARQLMLKYSGGQIDAKFVFSNMPPVVVPGLLTAEAQINFFKASPISTKFGFLRYTSTDTPNYDYMSTNELPLPGSPIVTISEGGQSAFNTCYEMVHAIQMRCRQLGLAVSIDDINTPDESFLLKKLGTVLPFLKQIGGAA